MTNAEKFEEVFGFKPDKEEMLPICQANCSYIDDNVCHCERWWNEEYKGDTSPFTAEKTAQWISIGDFECYCSNCHYWCYKRNRTRYCPNCGSRMV